MKIRIKIIKYFEDNCENGLMLINFLLFLFISFITARYIFYTMNESIYSLLFATLYSVYGISLYEKRKGRIFSFEIIFLPLDIMQYTIIKIYLLFKNSFIQYLFIDDFNCTIYEIIKKDLNRKEFYRKLETVAVFYLAGIPLSIWVFTKTNLNQTYLIPFILVYSIAIIIPFLANKLVNNNKRNRIFIPLYYFHYLLKLPIECWLSLSKLTKRLFSKKKDLNTKFLNKINKPIEYSSSKNSILLNALSRKEKRMKDET